MTYSDAIIRLSLVHTFGSEELIEALELAIKVLREKEKEESNS